MKSMTQNKCLIEFDFKTVTKLSYELYKLKISLALQWQQVDRFSELHSIYSLQIFNS